MTIKERITEDMKSAMRAHDTARLSALRLLLAAIKQREVDDRVGADFPQERQTLAVRRNGIDVHSCVLQRYDQAVDVGPVAAEGVVQTAYDCDFGGFLPINSLFPEVFLIVRDGFE